LGYAIPSGSQKQRATKEENLQKNRYNMAEEKEQRVYHCGECGGIIERRQIFCPTCGKKLDHYDFED
jgi:rubrerythrin